MCPAGRPEYPGSPGVPLIVRTGVDRPASRLSSTDITDSDLVAKARAGNRPAFEALVSRYSRRVFGLAYKWMRSREDAEEITQIAFVKAWQGLPNFQGGEEFRGWLFRIAVHSAADELRSRKRRRSVPLEDVSELELGSTAPEEADLAMDAEELAERLDQALGQLREEYRLVLLLRAREEMSYDEMAKTLGVPIGTVMSRLARARGQLRSLMQEKKP